MASVLYPYGKQALLNGDIDLDSDVIKVRGVSRSDYSYSDAHQFISEVNGYKDTGDYTLTGVDIALGVFDANDATPWASNVDIDNTKTIDAWVIFKDTNSATTSQLIAYIDIESNAVTPNGSDINIVWDDGVNKIFRI